MDEELKALLDEAHANGASPEQMDGIISLYNQKKKSQAQSSSSSSQDGSDGNASLPGTAPASSSPSSSGGLHLDQLNELGQPVIKQSDGTETPDPNFQVPNQPEENELAVAHRSRDRQAQAQKEAENDEEEAKRTGGKFNAFSLVGAANAGLAKVSDIGLGVAKFFHAVNQLDPTIRREDKEQPSAAMKTFATLSDWLRVGEKENPLPNTIPGQITKGVIETLPAVGAAVASGGGTIPGEFAAIGSGEAGYLTSNEILQNALTKASGPITKYLGAEGVGKGLNEGYDQSNGAILPTLLSGLKRGAEGVESGVALEGQMGAGEYLGGRLFSAAEKLGVVDGDGLITKQALKSLVGSPVAFATASAADDIANGRPVDWRNAVVSAATALPFEATHIIEAFDAAGDLKAKKEVLDQHAAELMRVQNNNGVVNFSSADPGDIIKAMGRPEDAQDLLIKSLGKGIDAQESGTYEEKNAAHLEQLELQQQSDIKRIGQQIIDKGPDAFIDEVKKSELPDEVKQQLTNNAYFINKAFNPIEVQKTDIGKKIGELNDKITEKQQIISNTTDQGEKQGHYVDLNDLIGQRVEHQFSLYDLSLRERNINKANLEAADQDKPVTPMTAAPVPEADAVPPTDGAPANENTPATSDVVVPETVTEHQPVEDDQKSAEVPDPEAPNADTGKQPGAPAETFTPLKIDSKDFGEAEIVAHKDNGAVTLRYDDGKEEDVQPEDQKTLGISTKDINEFKKLNGLEEHVPETLHERIHDLAGRIVHGEVEFSDADTGLHRHYGKEIEAEVKRIREQPAEEQASGTSPQENEAAKLSPEETETVRKAMSTLFPEVKTHYFDSAEDFNKAMMQTSLREMVERGATVHAFVDKNREIYFNPEFMNRDTQIHEQGHILTNWAYHYAPELYRKMISVGTNLGDIHQELRGNGYHLSGVPLYEEAFVTLLGREGANKLHETIFRPEKRSAVKQFIHEAWTRLERWVAEKTGFSLSKFANIDNMPMGKFIDYINEKYLLSDVKISDVSSDELKRRREVARAANNAQATTPRPAREPGESLSDYTKRLREYLEQQKREPDENVPPGEPPVGLPAEQMKAPDWDLDPETRTEKFTRKWQDYLNRAAKVQDAIDQAGGKINEGTDFYHAADLQGAKAAQHQKELYEKMVHSPEKDNPSFFDRLKKDGLNKVDLDNYLRAQHVEEFNREVGLRRREAFHAELNRLEGNRQKALKKDNANSAAYYEREIKKMQDQKNSKYLLMDDGASGMTNKEAQDILSAFKAEGKYDPLKKYGDEFVKEVSNKQLEVQLESGVIDRDTYDLLKTKYENYVPFHVEAFLEQKQGRNQGSKTNKVDNIIRRAKGSERSAEERVSPSTYGIIQLEKSYIEGEKNKTLNKLYNLVEQNPNDSVFEIVHPRYAPTYRRDGSVIGFKEITDPNIVKNAAQLYRDGRKVYIHIKDKTLLRAINREGIVKTIAVLDKVNSYFRAVSTVYSPEFWVTNSFKHVQLGAFNLTADGQKEIAGKLLKNSIPAMKAAFDYEHGKRESEWAPYIERYLQAGGKLTGIAPSTDIEKMQSISKMVDDIDKKKNLVQNTKDFIRYVSTFGDASGVGPRVAIFRAGLEQGLPDQQAATLSREVTINFNKKGEWSGIAGNFYLMFNAGAQGKLYMARKLITSPLARKLYGGFFVAGVMSAAMNHAFSDKDDDPVSEYEKQHNFILKNPYAPGNIKIPAGFGMNVPYYMGTKFYELITGQATPGQAAMGTAEAIFESFSPVAHADLLQTITPTEPGRSMVQYLENKNQFGSAIYKDPDKFGVRQPSSHVHFENTAPIFVKLAQGLNHATGGTGVKSGLLDFSPDAMQWIYNTSTGGLGTTVQDAAKTATGGVERAAQQVGFMPKEIALSPMEVRQVPFLRKFYTEGSPVNFRSVIFETLDHSGNSVIDNQAMNEFNNAMMGAVLKGQITVKQFKQYNEQLMQNQLRIQVGDMMPDMEKKEMEPFLKKRK